VADRLNSGHKVVGVDNLNDAYDVALNIGAEPVADKLHP
jgi:nucleoside-diphosphate-sugar epimerase